MVWLLIGALGVSIAADLDLSATQKGFLVGVPLLGGALLRIVVGAASDRIGPKPIGMALLLCQMVALSWAWLGTASYLQLLAVGAMLGVAGASFAIALPLASRAYPPAYQGTAMGVAASGNSGTVLSVLLAPRLAHLVGWQGVFGLMLVPVAATFLVFLWVVRPDIGRVQAAVRTPPRSGLAEILASPSGYWLSLLYAITFGGFVGFCSFLPIFLHDQYALDPVSAGTLTALCGLAGSLARPLGGYLADHRGGVRVLAGTLALIIVFVLALSPLLPLPLEAPLFVLTVATLGFGNGAVFQIVYDRFSKRMGAASGVIGAAGGFGGFLLPSWLGVLKDIYGSFASGFLLFAALSTVGLMSVFWVSRRDQATGRTDD